jgi:site-specific recombinase XerD
MAEPARKIELQIVRPGEQPGIDYYIGEFLQTKAAGKSPRTLEGYRSVLYMFRAHSGVGWPPTPAMIDSFLLAARARGLKDSTLDDYYRTLRVWLNWLYERGKLASNPIVLAEKPPRPKQIPRAPSRDMLRRFFAHLETVAAKGKGHWLDVRDLALWSLAYDTGLRVSELAGLTVGDITIEKHRRLAFVRGRKTHRDRVVVFHKTAAKDIKRWLKVRAALGLPGKLSALFVSDHRGEWRAFTPWGMRQSLGIRCERLGLGHHTPHEFRHAFAIYSLRNRADLLDVQKQLGHQSVVTTSRYTLVDDTGRAERHGESSPREKT